MLVRLAIVAFLASHIATASFAPDHDDLIDIEGNDSAGPTYQEEAYYNPEEGLILESRSEHESRKHWLPENVLYSYDHANIHGHKREKRSRDHSSDEIAKDRTNRAGHLNEEKQDFSHVPHLPHSETGKHPPAGSDPPKTIPHRHPLEHHETDSFHPSPIKSLLPHTERPHWGSSGPVAPLDPEGGSERPHNTYTPDPRPPPSAELLRPTRTRTSPEYFSFTTHISIPGFRTPSPYRKQTGPNSRPPKPSSIRTQIPIPFFPFSKTDHDHTYPKQFSVTTHMPIPFLPTSKTAHEHAPSKHTSAKSKITGPVTIIPVKSKPKSVVSSLKSIRKKLSSESAHPKPTHSSSVKPLPPPILHSPKTGKLSISTFEPVPVHTTKPPTTKSTSSSTNKHPGGFIGTN